MQALAAALSAHCSKHTVQLSHSVQYPAFSYASAPGAILGVALKHVCVVAQASRKMS